MMFGLMYFGKFEAFPLIRKKMCASARRSMSTRTSLPFLSFEMGCESER